MSREKQKHALRWNNWRHLRVIRAPVDETKIFFRVSWRRRIWTQSLIFISLTIKTCLSTEVLVSECVALKNALCSSVSAARIHFPPWLSEYILLSWSPLSALNMVSLWNNNLIHLHFMQNIEEKVPQVLHPAGLQ